MGGRLGGCFIQVVYLPVFWTDVFIDWGGGGRWGREVWGGGGGGRWGGGGGGNSQYSGGSKFFQHLHFVL